MAKRNRKGPFCGAQRRHGAGTCRRDAGAGTDHKGRGRCSWHGGCAPSSVKAARHQEAEEAAARLGLSIETTAEAALQDALDRANGLARYHASQVAALPDEARTWGTRKRTRVTAGGEVTDTEVTAAGPSVDEQQLLRWDQQLKEVAAEMLRAGIEQRRVRLAEEVGAFLTAVIGGSLRELGQDPRNEEVAAVVAVQIRMLREQQRFDVIDGGKAACDR